MSQEDLLVNIEVNTKPAKRGVEDLNEALAENTKQTKAIQKELQRLEKEYKSIATAAKKLPTEQAAQLAGEVKKAERATARLSDQFDRTSQKLEKVHSRTIDAAAGFSALTAAITAMANIDTLIRFTDRVNKAAQAVLQFSENVGPTITKTRDLFRKGFEQGSFIITNFTNIVKTAGAAITEHRQIMEGYQHVAVGIPRVHQAINDSFRGLASAAKFFERGFVAIRDFTKQTQEGVGRLRTLFNTVRDGSGTMMDILGQLGGVFGSTFGASTGGAARLNAFQLAYLNLQDILERASAKIGTSFKAVTTALGDFAARGAAAVGPMLQTLSARFLEIAKSAEALAAKGFGMMLKGFIDLGTQGLKLGQSLGFLGTGFIGFIDNTATIGAGLIGLGTLLKRTDSFVLDLAGSFLQLVGVLSVSLSAGLTIVTGLVGQFLLAVGDKLFALSDAWEEKFTKMQKVTQAFEFTIGAFSRKMGEAAVGSLEAWNTQIDELVTNTTFGVTEIQKSIKILISGTAQLGISADQNAELLKRAADLAAVTGQDLTETTQAITKAMGGEAGALKSMGIFVDNMAIQNSKLGKSQNLVASELSQQAKAQIVANMILEQTIPLVGAAANQLDTISGSQKQLSQNVELLQAKLGSQSVVWAQLTQLQAGFLASLAKLPDGFFDFIGIVVDTLGVLAKLGGAFLTTVLTIAGIKGAIELASLAVSQFKIAQVALNTVINVVRISIGLEAVAITTLKGAMIALGQTVIPGLIAAMKGFQLTLLTATKRVYAFTVSLFFTKAGWLTIISGATAATAAVVRFTVALLASPWTWVIGGIIATVVAFQQLTSELDQFKKKGEETNQSLTKTPGLLEQITSAAKNLGQVFVDIAKVIIIGWLKIVRVLELAAIGYQKLWAKITGNSDRMGELEVAQEKVLDKLVELEVAFDKTFGGGTAMAATMATEVGKVTEKVQGLAAAANTRFEFGVSSAQIGALGSEFEKTALAVQSAKFELGEMRKEVVKVAGSFGEGATNFLGDRFDPKMLNVLIAKLKAAGQDTKSLEEVASKFSDSFIRGVQAEASALALRNKTAEDSGKAVLDARKAELEAAGKMIEKIQLETQEKVKAKQEELKGLAILGQDIAVRREQVGQINKAIKAIKAQGAAQIEAVKKELDQKALEKREKENEVIRKRLQILDQLKAKLTDLAVENAKATEDLGVIAQAELDQQLAKIDVIQRQAMAYGPVTKAQQDILDQAKEIAQLKFEEMKPFTVGDLVGTLKSAFEKSKEFASKLFEGDLFKDFKLPSLDELKDIGKNVGKDLKAAFMKIDLGKVGSTIFEGLKAGAGFIMDMFNPDNINKVADFFEEFLQKLPENLGKAFERLDRVLGKFVEKFPEVLQKLLDMLPGIFQSILEKLPAVIDTLLKGLSKFLEMLPRLISMVFDALPGILDQFVKALPDIVLKLFDAVGKIIAKFIQVLPELLKTLIDGFPAFVAAFIEGIIAAMGDIVAAFVDFLIGGGLEKIVAAFLRMIPKLVVAIVQGIARGLARALGSLFNGIKAPPALEALPGKFAEGVKQLAAKTTEEASKLFKVLDLEAQAKGLDAAQQVEDMAMRVIDAFDFAFRGLFAWLEDIWNWVVARLEALWSFLKQIWDVVLQVLQALWDFLKLIWDGVIAALTGLWETLKVIWDAVLVGLKALWDTLKTIWDAVIVALTAIWDTLKSVWDGILTALKSMWDGLKDVVTNAFKGVTDTFANLKDTFTEAFKGIKKFFTDTLKGKIDDAFKGVLDTFKGIGGKIWEDLKSGIGDLGKTIKAQLDKISPANLFEKIFQMDYKGQGTVEKTLGIDIPYANFASGGMVPGSALVSGDSLLNDRILALLSPGEAVIPRSKMADPMVKSIVDQILAGTMSVPKFAFGSGGDYNPFDDGGGGGISNPFDGDSPVGKAFSNLGSAAQGALSGIGGTLEDLGVNAEQLKALGAAIDGGLVLGSAAVGKIAEAGKLTLGEAAAIAKAAGGTISGVGKASLDKAWKAVRDGKKTIGGLLKNFDPRQLWVLAKEEAFSVIMRSLEANAFHQGGLVPAFAGGGGEVPAMLQSGEFVINRQAVQSLGLGALSNLNQGNGMGDMEQNFEINLEIRSDGLPDESFIRQRLIPTMKKELKEASLRGEFLMSKKGLRDT